MVDTSIINLKGIGELAKPMEKMIEKVSAAVGVLYEPTRIRKEAKAKADAREIEVRNRMAPRCFVWVGAGGPAPQSPRHFALWGLPAGGHNEASQLGWSKLARLPYRPLSRRSSCVPAELYPPLRCLR
jgi:hypothetical protein